MFNKLIKIYSKTLKEISFTDELKYFPNEVKNLEITIEENSKERPFG